MLSLRGATKERRSNPLQDKRQRPRFAGLRGGDCFVVLRTPRNDLIRVSSNQNIDRKDGRLPSCVRSSMILLTALIVHLSTFISCVQAQPVISICHTPWYELHV